MDRKLCYKGLLVGAFLVIAALATSENAFAWERSRHHETVVVGRHKYHYRDGRFYSPGWFGIEFYIGSAPAGAVIRALPYGHRTVVVGGTTYYYYDNVYYRPCPSGYVVVNAPVVTPEVVYVPDIARQSAHERETVTINVPNNHGGVVAITLVRYPNGFVGPQGEFYHSLPTSAQLRGRYGR